MVNFQPALMVESIDIDDIERQAWKSDFPFQRADNFAQFGWTKIQRQKYTSSDEENYKQLEFNFFFKNFESEKQMQYIRLRKKKSRTFLFGMTESLHCNFLQVGPA